MSNVVSNLMPGSCINVYFEYSKLTKKYDELFQPIVEAMPSLKNPSEAKWTQTGTKEQLQKVRSFYDNCNKMDLLMISSFITGLIKAVSGIAVAILFPQGIIGLIALTYGLEGISHIACTLKGFFTPRWHINADDYSKREQTLVFTYGRLLSAAN